MPGRHTVLCLTSYFKGNRFLMRAKNEGCHVILLTVESTLKEPWARDHIDEVFALKSFEDRRHVIHSIAYLNQTRPIDRLIALDDYDVELGGFLREHFRLPGMGDTVIRRFRDKLTMRYHAREVGIRVPEFIPLFNNQDIRQFLDIVPGPWLIKPRMEASAIGIKKHFTPTTVWQDIEQRGDDRSFCLLEKMVPGDLFHVDSIVHRGKVVFTQVSRYERPLLDVYHGGGIFMSRTLPTDHPDSQELERINAQLLHGFEMDACASHTEFMKAHEDQAFYFIETSARVGGANITEMVEAARGLNLWEEWAQVEIDRDQDYKLPALHQMHAGVIVSLARQEKPDTSSFQDEEIYYRLDKKNHIGFVLLCETSERLDALLREYQTRIQNEYLAVLPAASKATS